MLLKGNARNTTYYTFGILSTVKASLLDGRQQTEQADQQDGWHPNKKASPEQAGRVRVNNNIARDKTTDGG